MRTQWRALNLHSEMGAEFVGRTAKNLRGRLIGHQGHGKRQNTKRLQNHPHAEGVPALRDEKYVVNDRSPGKSDQI